MLAVGHALLHAAMMRTNKHAAAAAAGMPLPWQPHHNSALSAAIDQIQTLSCGHCAVFIHPPPPPPAQRSVHRPL